jgi:hypothetical protein
LFLSCGRINLFYAAGPSDANGQIYSILHGGSKMASKSSPQLTIRNALKKRHRPCRETRNFLAKNRLKIPIIADMLQALPCVSQKDLLNRYGRHIPQVEKGLFDDIAGEWFSSGPTKTVHGRYILIDDLKEMLVAWGFHAFYEKHKKKLPINVNDELIDKLNIYYCLDELFESQVNKAHETALIKKVKGTRISADAVRDTKLAMISETAKTFFISAILNIQLKWMLALMDLAYLDGSMRASLDSEEYENFKKMHQAVNLSSVDELVDMIEMFPPHTSKESISALRELLKDTDAEIMEKIGKEKKKLFTKR